MIDPTSVTMQEIFDIAYRGMESQGFRKCERLIRDMSVCVYDDGKGNHCAWGWVEKAYNGCVGLDSEEDTSVIELANVGIGLAGELARLGRRRVLDLARSLQMGHDSSYSPEEMSSHLRNVARYYDLTVPDSATAGQGCDATDGTTGGVAS